MICTLITQYIEIFEITYPLNKQRNLQLYN